MTWGLLNLIKAKWTASGRQPGLKGDFLDVETAILQVHQFIQVPNIVWVDTTEIKVPATVDSPAALLMSGFPNILHPGQFVNGGLTDGRYREITADAILDLDIGTSLWGTEKAGQLYVIFALAGNADAVFTIKAMPYMRVKSQASQVISLGTLVTPGTGIGYGFTTDELIGGMVYVLSGASKGSMRAITANNNDNTTGGTITYGGAALTLSAGDVFIVLPPGTNFRMVGAFYNNLVSHIEWNYSLNYDQEIEYVTVGTHPFITPPWVYCAKQIVCVGGGGGVNGGGGGVEIYGHYPVAPGAYSEVIVGLGNTGAGNGGDTSFGTLPHAHGGTGSAGPGGILNPDTNKYRIQQAAGFDCNDAIGGSDSGLRLGQGGRGTSNNGVSPGGGGGHTAGDGACGAVYVTF